MSKTQCAAARYLAISLHTFAEIRRVRRFAHALSSKAAITQGHRNAPVWKDVYGTNIGAYDNDVLGWFDYNNNQWNVFTADYRPRNTVSRNHDTWTGTCANNKYLSSCSSDNDCKDGDKDWGTCVEYESPTIVYDGTPSSIADIENAPPNK